MKSASACPRAAVGVGLVLLLELLPVLQQPHPILAAPASQARRPDRQRHQVALDDLPRRRRQLLDLRQQPRRPRLQRLRYPRRPLVDAPRAPHVAIEHVAGQGHGRRAGARFQVAELRDLEGQPPQVLEPQSQPQAALDARPGGALLLAPEPVLPVLVEAELLADRVHHLEAGVQPRVERPLAQQARGEGVNRLDVRRVDLLDGGPQPVLLAGVGAVQRAVEIAAHAVAQFARRLLGERDRDDLAQLRPAPAHRLDDAPHQHRRLAGAGARLQEDRRIQVALGALAHRLVGRGPIAVAGGARLAHRRACSLRKSCTTPRSSRALSAKRLSTSVAQTLR